MDETHGTFYDPQNVRPISVANFDGRILSQAVRLRVEPLFEDWVSRSRRGFIGGLSLLANVLDIEERMMEVSPQSALGGEFILRTSRLPSHRLIRASSSTCSPTSGPRTS